MIIFLGNNNTDKYKFLIEKSVSDRDIVVSCQYPFRVPSSLLESHTCVNIHYGDLPKFAGCNPIYWQIMEGNVAAVTLHYMDSGFDSGDIIDKAYVNIGCMTADELFGVLEDKGVILFQKWYRDIINNIAPRNKQDLSERDYKNKKAVNFNNKDCGSDDKIARALHFSGKQYPTIKIGKRTYEISSDNSRL